MPSVIHSNSEQQILPSVVSLGPRGPFPNIELKRVLERRWLHYAFLSRDNELGMVANIAWLGPPCDQPELGPRCTSILLVHKRNEGWCASQFNAKITMPLWSAFQQPQPSEYTHPFELEAIAETPAVKLQMQRTSRPCTSQCASFSDKHHLRWQSETGVIARGDWRFKNQLFQNVEAIGYNERVRGCWGWPELGGWVFGFTNDPEPRGDGPPPTAVVFTLIQPPKPDDSANASVMVWRDGRLRRHFARRCISVVVHGQLDRNHVCQLPELANRFGVTPMSVIPQRLVISARMGYDWVVIDFLCEAAARVVIPSETGIKPFSVHEVIGPCRIEGQLNKEKIGFETYGIVEFAGGAGGD